MGAEFIVKLDDPPVAIWPHGYDPDIYEEQMRREVENYIRGPLRPGIHHLTIGVAPGKLAAEKLFWGILGYSASAIPSRGSHPNAAYWLVNRRSGDAIHLHPHGREFFSPTHIGIIEPDLSRVLGRLQTHDIAVEDDLVPFLGCARAYVHSPSENTVELLDRRPPLLAGMPTEGTG